MSTTGGESAFLRGVFEGCLSGADTGITRRPYHKNCKCALHKSRDKHSRHSCCGTNVSYPIRRSWSEGCLALMAHAQSPSDHSSPMISPGKRITRTQTQLVLCNGQEDEIEMEVEFDRLSISKFEV